MLRRSILLAWLVAILGILAPSIASAATTANLQTRVKGFALVAPTLIGRSDARTTEKHPEKSNAYDGIASGSLVAAEETIPRAFARELLPADLGLGPDAQFIGRISGTEGGAAVVEVDWIGGEMGNSGMAALARLKDTARASGATSIEIQTSRIVETTGVLQRWLTRRGFTTQPGGSMLFRGKL